MLRWLTLELVEAIHSASQLRFGGAPGVRDLGLLESALARPKNIALYENDVDVFHLAAAYAFGLIKNHPFVDGNKRAGLLVCVVFLELNGAGMAFDEQEIVNMVTGLASGEVDEQQFANWLRANAGRIV